MFDPPESYWGTARPAGVGGATYVVPNAMQYPVGVDFVNHTWSDPGTGQLHTIQGARCGGNWIFQIDRNPT